MLPKIANTDFVEAIDSVTTHYKVVFQFKDTERNNIPTFKKELDSVLKEVKYYRLSSSVDLYNPQTTFVLVHGIKNEAVAKTFKQLLTDKNKKKIIKPFFVISSANYQTIQIHKNLEAYLNPNNQ
ncbi:TPR domain protein [Algibacter lectus]|uniref:TPR domain protein n=1 Tax=Algibacter lectus TaxID=221126 RepID=A0A090X1Z0_9FLAO|nr:TPR domain protein [Algibacter lectus]